MNRKEKLNMKKEELIAKGLTEEQATAVIDIYTNEMKGLSRRPVLTK